MMTRRLPGLPPSHSCCVSSMPSWPTSRSPVKPRMWLIVSPAGIEAAVLGLVVDAFDLQRGNARGDLRRNLLREEDEVAAVVELLRERLRRRLERDGEQRSSSGVASTCPGNAQIDLTGVEIASGSPMRSTMRPRCAGSSISRL